MSNQEEATSGDVNNKISPTTIKGKLEEFLKVPDLCRFCGLPIVPGKVNPGTMEDGRSTNIYCEFCLQNNKLLNEGKTKQEMIEWMTQVYIERFGWKNHKGARFEAKNSYQTMKNINSRGRGLTVRSKLILLFIFIVLTIIFKFLL